jgi:hypothetical protein
MKEPVHLDVPLADAAEVRADLKGRVRFHEERRGELVRFTWSEAPPSAPPPAHRKRKPEHVRRKPFQMYLLPIMKAADRLTQEVCL